MYREKESDALICANLDERFQNQKYLERTFEEVWRIELNDNNDYDNYFPLDDND
ncbi:MAG: hypothetical protein HY790_09160 [Deltaproteobacteria bacterium]|nr:hypothetical protein [Deltaproteobacteria bacterium]MBI4795986.1 hypothetical protein [Deltaproteobacteria bacterium]